MADKTKEKHVARMEHFSRFEDKVKLIEAVKAQPIIWDFTHKGHFNSIFIGNAWDAIAAELHKDVKVVRNAWRSLRDSMRYHTKTAKNKKKSGSAGGCDIGAPKANDELDWSLGPHMSFLPDLSEQRRTTQIPSKPSMTSTLYNIEDSENMVAEYLDDFPTCSSDPSFKVEEELEKEVHEELEKDLEKKNSTSYSYKPPRKKRKIESTNSCQLTEKFTEYVDLQKNLMTQTPKVRSMCNYWGEIIQDLPETFQHEAEEKMTQLLWEIRSKAKAFK